MFRMIPREPFVKSFQAALDIFLLQHLLGSGPDVGEGFYVVGLLR